MHTLQSIGHECAPAQGAPPCFKCVERGAPPCRDGRRQVPLLHAAYPLLIDLPTTEPEEAASCSGASTRRCSRWSSSVPRLAPCRRQRRCRCHLHWRVLSDFIFTIIVVFQGWGSPPSEDEIHGDDRTRQLRDIGPKEAWAGTLSAAKLGRPDADAPTFELLQLDAVRALEP